MNSARRHRRVEVPSVKGYVSRDFEIAGACSRLRRPRYSVVAREGLCEHAIFLRNLTSNFAGRQNYLRDEKFQGRVKIYSVLFRRAENHISRARAMLTQDLPAAFVSGDGTMLTQDLP